MVRAKEPKVFKVTGKESPPSWMLNLPRMTSGREEEGEKYTRCSSHQLMMIQ